MQDIKEKAFDKVYAKLTTLNFEIQRLRENLKYDNTGGIDAEQLQGVIEQTEEEKLIYMYLFTLIEKDNKL
jgi:hypothetical protein